MAKRRNTMVDNEKGDWPKLDYMKRGTILEFDSLSIAIVYGFRHFMGPRVLTIDVQRIEGVKKPQSKQRRGKRRKESVAKADKRKMPDFAVLETDSYVALGECKACWGDEAAVIVQLEKGLEKVATDSVKHRFLLMPVKEVFDLSERLTTKFPNSKLTKRKYAASKRPVNSHASSNEQIHTYQVEDGDVHWNIYEYKMGLELAVCAAIITENDDQSSIESLLWLGELVFKQICRKQISRIRKEQQAELGRDELLDGEYPDHERQIALMLHDAWAFLTEEYLRRLAEATAAAKGWIGTFKKLLESKSVASEQRVAVDSQAIEAMRPAFASEVSGKKTKQSLGVRIRSDNSPALKLTIVEARSGMGKSVSMIREAHAIAEALLHSGGLIGIGTIPFHLDLKSVAEHLFNRQLVEKEKRSQLDEYTMQDTSPLDGLGITFLSEHFHDSMLRRLRDASNGQQGEDGKPFTLGTLPEAVAALLSRFPVTLLIDGYDHAVSADRASLLRPLLENLEAQGVVVKRVILTSREGFGAAQAFTVKEGTETIVMTIDRFRNDEQKRYFRQWVSFLFSRAGYRERFGAHEPEWRDFRDWLEKKTHPTEYPHGLRAFDNVCLINSLLFNISILAFLLDKDKGDTTSKAPSETAFIDDLITKLPIADDGQDKRADLRRESTLREAIDAICFSLLCREKRQIGIVDGRTLIVLPQDGINKGDSTLWPRSLRDFCEVDQPDLFKGASPLFHFRRLDGPESEHKGQLEFLHPSFQEFFAGCFLADCLGEGVIPIASRFSGKETPDDWALDVSEFTSKAALEMRSIIRWAGPMVFKYVFGRLAADAIDKKPRKQGLMLLLEILSVDPPLQQYLYDAAFLDEISLELDLVNAAPKIGLETEAKILVKKFLGHALYGEADEAQVIRGVKILQEAIDALNEVTATKGLGTRDRILNVFLRDHVWNRSEYSAEVEKEIESLVSRTLGEAPEENDYPLLFRSAIFWGHVGNQRLRAMEKAAESNKWLGIAVDFERAEEVYWMSIVFRLFCFPTNMESKLSEKVWGLVANYQKLPVWAVQVHKDIAKGSIEYYEHSMDSGQAIGDIAHQFSCLSQVYVWQYLCKVSTSKSKQSAKVERKKICTKAVKAQELAGLLWDLAVESRGRENSGTIKYYLWYPQTKLSVQMLAQHCDSKAGVVPISDSSIEAELQSALNRAGIRYARAELGVKRNLELIKRRLF